MKCLLPIFACLVASFVLGAQAVSAQDGLRGALFNGAKSPAGVPGFSHTIAAADFDRDSKPDGAVLSQIGFLNGQRLFRIDLHFSSNKNLSLTFSSVERALDVTAIDVNRDGAPDLVVEKRLTRERIQVFLNNGHGAFERVPAEAFPASNESLPLFSTRLTSQGPPLASLPPTRRSELSNIPSKAVLLARETGISPFWPEGRMAQCGARAPSASRAPPSFLN